MKGNIIYLNALLFIFQPNLTLCVLHYFASFFLFYLFLFWNINTLKLIATYSENAISVAIRKALTILLIIFYLYW